MRICVGVCLLVDLLIRSTSLRSHYTAVGFLPLRNFIPLPETAERSWSLFFLGDSVFIAALLFALSLTAALGLTLGIQTRICGWVCWALLLSVCHRNPVICNKGDFYLVAVLFWCNFLPWGEAFSCGASGEPVTQDSVQSPASFCLITQIACLYLFPSVIRSAPSWQVDGSALYYTLYLENFNTVFADYAGRIEISQLAFWCRTVSYFELLGPILLFLPFARLRLFAVLAMVCFHVSLGLVVYIPNFALAAASIALGLLPGFIWESGPGARLAASFDRGFSRLSEPLPERMKSTGQLPARVERMYGLLPWPALFLLLICLAWRIEDPTVRPPLVSVAEVFGLNQRWDMFAPGPPNLLTWPVAKARLESGRIVNLRTLTDYEESNQCPDFRPILDNRQRILFFSLKGQQVSRLYLSRLIRDWNALHPDDPVVVAQLLRLTSTIPEHRLVPEYRREVWLTLP